MIRNLMIIIIFALPLSAKTYHFGINYGAYSSARLKTTIEIMPFLAYLSEKTALEFELKTFKNDAELFYALKSGAADIVYMDAISYAAARRQMTNIEPIAVSSGSFLSQNLTCAIARIERGDHRIDSVKRAAYAKRDSLCRAETPIEDFEPIEKIDASDAVLSLLIGETDAIWTTTQTIERYKHLNLIVSEGKTRFPNSILARNTSTVSERDRKRIIDALSALQYDEFDRSFWAYQLRFGFREAIDADFDSFRDKLKKAGLF